MEIKYPDVTVQLTGRDGNAFSIVAAVSGALRRQIGSEAADTFAAEALNQRSYDALLRHAMATVTVV